MTPVMGFAAMVLGLAIMLALALLLVQLVFGWPAVMLAFAVAVIVGAVWGLWDEMKGGDDVRDSE